MKQGPERLPCDIRGRINLDRPRACLSSYIRSGIVGQIKPVCPFDINGSTVKNAPLAQNQISGRMVLSALLFPGLSCRHLTFHSVVVTWQQACKVSISITLFGWNLLAYCVRKSIYKWNYFNYAKVCYQYWITGRPKLQSLPEKQVLTNVPMSQPLLYIHSCDNHMLLPHLLISSWERIKEKEKTIIQVIKYFWRYNPKCKLSCR